MLATGVLGSCKQFPDVGVQIAVDLSDGLSRRIRSKDLAVLQN